MKDVYQGISPSKANMSANLPSKRSAQTGAPVQASIICASRRIWRRLRRTHPRRM